MPSKHTFDSLMLFYFYAESEFDYKKKFMLEMIHFTMTYLNIMQHLNFVHSPQSSLHSKVFWRNN